MDGLQTEHSPQRREGRKKKKKNFAGFEPAVDENGGIKCHRMM